MYDCAISQRLPVNDFKWVGDIFEFDESLPFLPERMKIEKVKKFIANLHDETEYVIHIKNLRQALNHRLVLKKFHRGIKFSQKAQLKPHILI